MLKLSAALLMAGCSVVGPGEKGIRVTFGEVKPEMLNAGFYFSAPPLTYLKHVDLRVQKSSIATSAASRDMQEITTEIAINWQLEHDKVIETFVKVGDEEVVYQKVLQPAVSEILKSQMAHMTAEEILSKRTELKENIDKSLRERLQGYGILALDVSIVNLSFSHDFTKAIEEKQIAEQSAKRAQYIADRAVKEAQAAVNTAKGEAEAQRLQEHTLTPQMLQKLAIDKWDGQLPTYMFGGDGQQMPFIRIGD